MKKFTDKKPEQGREVVAILTRLRQGRIDFQGCITFEGQYNYNSSLQSHEIISDGDIDLRFSDNQYNEIQWCYEEEFYVSEFEQEAG